MLILLNFKTKNAAVNLGNLDISKAQLLQGNYDEKVKDVKVLRPYEAVVYAL